MYAPLSTDAQRQAGQWQYTAGGGGQMYNGGAGGGAMYQGGAGMGGGGGGGMMGGGMHGGMRGAGMHGGGMMGGGMGHGGMVAGPGLGGSRGTIVTTGSGACDPGCAGSVGCGEAGCATGQAGCFATETAVAGNLAYVGTGGGDWVTETTYKYVGAGAGDLAVVSTARHSFLPFLLGLLVVVGVVLLFLFWPTGATTTKVKAPSTLRPATTALAPPPVPLRRTCKFWGDPHLVTFDGGRPSFYGDGDFWIVKNDDVMIQGRYEGTPYTYGLAATQKLVVGGPFLQQHIIEVEPLQHNYGGHILVDGEPVLMKFGEHIIANGLATVRYDDQGELPDKAASKWAKKIVHLHLPNDITVTVFRWGNYLDLTIEMRKLEGDQDGSCGNFNGEAGDDTTEAIFNRVGARVPQSDLLFSRRAEITFTTEETQMMRDECPQDNLVRNEQACRKDLEVDVSTQEVNACVFDMCFGSNEHALKEAKTYATPEDKAAAEH